jgi:hypothetical protein
MVPAAFGLNIGFRVVRELDYAVISSAQTLNDWS